MSAWMGPSRGAARMRLPRFAEDAVERARLTVVPRRRTRAPRVPFMILVSLVLLGGVVGLLLLNTHMQQVSFHATALQGHAERLHAQEQSLRMQLDRLRDPQRVATQAQALGMVPMVNPAFLRLSDGAELGNPVAAAPADRQRITPLPPRKPAEFHKAPVRVPADPVPDPVPERGPDTGADGVPSDVPASGPGTTD
jgi:hypothetical protein